MTRLKILAAFIFFPQLFMGQVVWTDPQFPTADDVVTLYYDATQGNGEVAGVVPLYTHTGVITSNSSGLNDWQHVVGNWGTADDQVLMTAEGVDIYSFDFGGLTLNEFYGVNAPEEILELAFVFRNMAGTLVGREADGSDIFFPLSDGSFSASLLSPAASSTAIATNELLNVEVITSQEAAISIFLDGTEVATTPAATSLTFNFISEVGGEFVISYTANNGSSTVEGETLIVVVSPPSEAFPAPGSVDGITYLDDQSVHLQVYAPGKENIFVVGDFNNWQFGLDYQMTRTPDQNTFWIDITGLTPGEYYRFHYHILPDGMRVGDAYSELWLDKWNDGWIPEATYPNLLDFPDGLTSNDPVSVLQPGAPAFDWSDENFQRSPKEKLMVYELLVRDFSELRTWDFLTDTLSYLENLGISAVEIMPFTEFPGNESWGYNNAMYFAPDKAYGPKESLQNFINEAHNRGIAVIMDVAFNHADWPNPFLKMYWDPEFGQWGAPSTNNPWFNQVAPHDLNWFFDWNHESGKTKQFVKRFMEFWLAEYHIDGWRWDYSQGFTQNNTIGMGSGGYDQSRIDILTDYGNHIWSIDPDVYMILEHWTDNSEETVLANSGFMIWGNITHNYQEAAMGYASNFSWANYQNRGWNEPGLVTYMESHDEERLMYKNLEFGNSAGDYDIQNLETALARIELTSCFHFCIPGPKMLWQFGELGYDYSINYCTDGSINEECRTYAKPVRWDYRAEEARFRIYQVMAALLHLKKTEDAFSTSDFSMDVAGFGKSIHLNHPDMNVVIVGNFSVTGINMQPGFQNTGTWYDYFSGASFEVSDVNMAFDYAPGEYHIYTTQLLETPQVGTEVEELSTLPELKVWPNPFDETLQLDLSSWTGEKVVVELQDLTGRVVQVLHTGVVAAHGGFMQMAVDRTLQSGCYVLNLRSTRGQASVKVIKR